MTESQKLCTVQSVNHIAEGYIVYLEEDTVFCQNDPEVAPTDIVVLDPDNMRIERLFYSYGANLYVLRNDQNVYVVKGIRCHNEVCTIYTQSDTLIVFGKPDFAVNDIIIIQPDQTILAPFTKETYQQYTYLQSAYDALSVY